MTQEKNKTARPQSRDAEFKINPGNKKRLPPKDGESNKGLDLAIQGENIQDKQEREEKLKENSAEYFQNRVLKGIPEMYVDDPQMKHLAQGLQRDIIISSPNVKFDSIVGLESAKSILVEAVKLPLIYPELFTGLIEPWKGVLLFGPPGTGKTMLAKAVASECQTIFFNISASSIVSKWQGESEKLIRILFELAKHH